MTVEEMKETLSRLGLETFDERGDEIQVYCAAHLERTGHIDHNPSLWINSDSGAFICFSCQWKGNIYTIIEYVEGINGDEAQEWLGSDTRMLTRFQRLLEQKSAPKLAEPSVVTESMLSAFVDVPKEACTSRGLLQSMTNKYGIRWNARENNWVIPIRDPETKALLGWQEKGHDRRYFKNLSKVKKSEALFGYDQYQGGQMIVVESPLDVVRLASLGISGGVATYGALISDVQFNIIRGADKVIFALDNDEAGRVASKAMLKKCIDMGAEAWFFNYGESDAKDIGGMSLEEVVYGLNGARHMIKGIVGAL